MNEQNVKNVPDTSQKLVDICFQVALTINNPAYRKTFKKMTREQTAEWVSKQLEGCGFKTEPCGASWGVLK